MSDIPKGDGKYETRITRLTLVVRSEALFDERSTDIELTDEAAGEFVVVTQKSGHNKVQPQTISIDPDEWPVLRDAIEFMVKEARET